jgi:hypothetical protein
MLSQQAKKSNGEGGLSHDFTAFPYPPSLEQYNKCLTIFRSHAADGARLFQTVRACQTVRENKGESGAEDLTPVYRWMDVCGKRTWCPSQQAVSFSAITRTQYDHVTEQECKGTSVQGAGLQGGTPLIST